MTFHDRARFPRGFRCASRNVGLKPEARDLTLFASDVDAAAAAVFTRNQFPGAPIVLGRETMKGGTLRAIIANSKVSNVATGERGIENARRMAAAAAAAMRRALSTPRAPVATLLTLLLAIIARSVPPFMVSRARMMGAPGN